MNILVLMAFVGAAMIGIQAMDVAVKDQWNALKDYAPTVEELEQRRVEEERRLAEQRNVKYAPIKQKLFAAWDRAERDKGETVSGAVVDHFSIRSPGGMLLVYPEPIWEYLNWLMPEAFAKAKVIIENPAAATVEQIKEAIILLYAFLKHSSKHDSQAASYRFVLTDLYDKRTKK